MSLYNDLTTVLTPYANKIKQNESDIDKIKQNESDIGDIQDELSAINESLNAVERLENAPVLWTDGSYISTSGSTVDLIPIPSQDGFRYAVLDTIEGDKWIVTATGGRSPRTWCFVDASLNVLSVSSENKACTGEIITAPTNATKIILNDKTGTTIKSYKITNISSLADRIKYFDDCFATEIPDVTFTTGKAIVAATSSSAYGGASIASILSYSNYISIDGALFIDMSFPTYSSDTTFGMVFYDSSKNPVYGTVIEKTGEMSAIIKRFEIPDGAVSMRTSYFTDTATYGDFYIKAYKSFHSNWNPAVLFTSSKGVIADPDDMHYGEENTSTYLKVTNYIALNRNLYNSLELTMPIYAARTTYGAVFYDEDKHPISGHIISATGTNGTEKRTLPIPYTAKYIKTCYWMDESTYGEFSIRCLNAPQRDGLDVHVYPASMSAACEGMGYVCTGVNDEKVIQKAVNEVARLGCGRVLLAPGIYYIDSFYSAGDGDIPSAICMPSDYNKITIICEQGDPRLVVDNNYINASRQCAVLRVTSAAYESVDTLSSVIRAYKYSTTYRKSVLNIENIAISLPNNQKPIICIDGKNASHMMLDNVKMCAISGGNYTRPVENCIGVRGMQGSNDGTCDRWDNLSAYGFREGFAVSGEHLVCTNLLGRKCFYGYTFNNYTNGLGAWLHPITMINCADELNENMPLFGHNGERGQTDSLGGRQTISMIDFNLEWISSEWQSDSGIRATEIMPGEWYGNINYTIQPSYGGNTKNAVNIPFWASGSGVNVKTINDAQKQIVTTSERTSYAANNMQRVYDTDTGKFYTYINGTWIEEQ